MRHTEPGCELVLERGGFGAIDAAQVAAAQHPRGRFDLGLVEAAARIVLPGWVAVCADHGLIVTLFYA